MLVVPLVVPCPNRVLELLAYLFFESAWTLNCHPSGILRLQPLK